MQPLTSPSSNALGMPGRVFDIFLLGLFISLDIAFAIFIFVLSTALPYIFTPIPSENPPEEPLVVHLASVSVGHTMAGAWIEDSDTKDTHRQGSSHTKLSSSFGAPGFGQRGDGDDKVNAGRGGERAQNGGTESRSERSDARNIKEIDSSLRIVIEKRVITRRISIVSEDGLDIMSNIDDGDSINLDLNPDSKPTEETEDIAANKTRSDGDEGDSGDEGSTRSDVDGAGRHIGEDEGEGGNSGVGDDQNSQGTSSLKGKSGTYNRVVIVSDSEDSDDESVPAIMYQCVVVLSDSEGSENEGSTGANSPVPQQRPCPGFDNSDTGSIPYNGDMDSNDEPVPEQRPSPGFDDSDTEATPNVCDTESPATDEYANIPYSPPIYNPNAGYDAGAPGTSTHPSDERDVSNSPPIYNSDAGRHSPSLHSDICRSPFVSGSDIGPNPFLDTPASQNPVTNKLIIYSPIIVDSAPHSPFPVASAPRSPIPINSVGLFPFPNSFPNPVDYHATAIHANHDHHDSDVSDLVMDESMNDSLRDELCEAGGAGLPANVNDDEHGRGHGQATGEEAVDGEDGVRQFATQEELDAHLFALHGCICHLGE
ncbi:hypothetical protein DFP72DRAFT_862859 [Ephemerocybe angulata]|uniref:Uncharacterized protein n=1 Tax=Ephemerocybe angulata TaxID=980116 RepID=A0A8H6H6A6_9AGAR|nr:hypothetical protein DFP72DRAFT_862859 [Tulosesus angulatus]